jgi:hypothetical protein
VSAGLLLAACGSSPQATRPKAKANTGPTTSVSTTTTTPSVAPPTPPAIPATGAYLGAWVQPTVASGQQSFADEQQAVPAVQAATGRPLALLHIYSSWQQPAPTDKLAAVAANGSTPLLDWGCPPDDVTVTSGAGDQLITAYADALKAYGKPVLLRWCWEMNLARAHGQVGGPQAYVSAWQHIRTVFNQVGVTNVAFVWCPALTGTDPTPYYPGNQYVDWIGIDGYDRSGSMTFEDLFADFYQQWAPMGKPMMVAETGAHPAAQVAYLQSIATDMPAMPDFKAVVYFDAPGKAGQWALEGPGLAAFAALAQSPYFRPS